MDRNYISGCLGLRFVGRSAQQPLMGTGILYGLTNVLKLTVVVHKESRKFPKWNKTKQKFLNCTLHRVELHDM